MKDDGWRYELVDGELRKMTPSAFLHGAIVVALTRRLAQHVDDQALGIVTGAETGFLLARSPDTVRAPDVAFVKRERIERLGVPAEFWSGAPDLAVEVTSPGDTPLEVEAKVRDWLTAGAGVVWVVNPKLRRVTVWRGNFQARILSEHERLEGEDIVPGFGCQVSELFAGIV
jgi:Uma2 family endonuclease